jgi:hypothetical protein
MTEQDDERIAGKETLNDDYDRPWKDAVEHYFPEFMAFYYCGLVDETAGMVRSTGLARN